MASHQNPSLLKSAFAFSTRPTISFALEAFIMGGGWLVFDNAQILWVGVPAGRLASAAPDASGRAAPARFISRTLKEITEGCNGKGVDFSLGEMTPQEHELQGGRSNG
jgi:hypothetical protein